MAGLEVGTDLHLRGLEAYKAGRVGSRGLEGMLGALKDSNAGGDGPPQNPVRFTSTLVGAAVTVKGSPGIVYGVRAVNSQVITADVIVQLLDGATVVHASVPLRDAISGDATVQACEAYFYGSEASVVGVRFTTDIRVRVVLASDGTTAATTVNRPDVVVLYA